VQEREFGPQVGDAVDRDQGARPGGADACVALEHPFLSAPIQLDVQLPRLLGVAAGPQLLASLGKRAAGQQRPKCPVVGFPEVPAC
jgi:hypothetical protein